MVIYITRVALSVAVVAMYQTHSANQTSNNGVSIPYCLLSSNESILTSTHSLETKETLASFTNTSDTLETFNKQEIEKDERMYITSTQRGCVLGAFFFGYFVASFFGGHMADTFGTKRVFGGAVATSMVVDLLVPTVAKWHYIALICFRFVSGFGQAACFPSLHVLMVQWIPPSERPRFQSFAYQANSVGIITFLPIAGQIIGTFGWEAVFYTSAGISFLWLIMWLSLMYDKPEYHPRISDKEKKYILEELGDTISKANKPKKIPLKSMVSSLRVWAVTIAHAGNMIGLHVMMTQLPIYMATIIGVDIKKNGALSAIPFIGRFIGANFFGIIGTYVYQKEILKGFNLRRVFTFIAMGLPGCTMMLVSAVECSANYALSMLTLGSVLNGAFSTGYASNHLDLSPNYAGTLLGLTNTFAFFCSMMTPVVVGVLTPNEIPNEWKMVFWITAFCYMGCALFFVCFGTNETQPWNSEKIDGEEMEQMQNMNDESADNSLTRGDT